ncbi:Hypothetical protein D9617_20g028330 [Elsinoe fawcettii]|nr:Hypothetical protein D9617_20g028330 [Elsinoe fawcettii]
MPSSPRRRSTHASITNPISGRRRSSHVQPLYRIPQGSHLLITTPGAIHAWDNLGMHKIFNSSRQGILATKASKDGKQVLAVANSHVVVLHDCKRNREESWGLSSPEGHSRLLEYTTDAKSLFLSTTLTGAIQCYSIYQARMSRPGQEHPSPPTVLAVNSNAQLMISASENPPVTYIQNVNLGTPAHKFEPSASTTPVVAAAFHPDRLDIFLLGFKDGTLAAYNATKMARKNGVRMDVNSSLDMEGQAAEISVFSRLHRTTNKSSFGSSYSYTASEYDTSSSSVHDQGVGITSAAFVPGFLSRAVSVGGDGQCHIVDFADNGTVLQTWTLHARATSLAVLRKQKSKGPSRVNMNAVNPEFGQMD